MDEDIRREIERATQAAVDQKWNQHMDAMRPKLIVSYIGTYIAGLGSGIALQKYLFGPRWLLIHQMIIYRLTIIK